MRRVEIELDEELLARVDKLATASGRPRGDVITDALRRQLGRPPADPYVGTSRARVA